MEHAQRRVDSIDATRNALMFTDAESSVLERFECYCKRKYRQYDKFRNYVLLALRDIDLIYNYD